MMAVTDCSASSTSTSMSTTTLATISTSFSAVGESESTINHASKTIRRPRNSPPGLPISIVFLMIIASFVTVDIMARSGSHTWNRSLFSVIMIRQAPSTTTARVETNQGEMNPTAETASDQAPIHIVPSKSKRVKTNETSKPAIAWLMSFPNSGTSYTINTVRKASNRATGTNYGSEGMDYLDAKRKLPPFIHGKKLGRLLPKKYLLTKTHCGNNCAICGPDQYIKTVDAFRHDCTTAFSKSSNGTRTTEKTLYSLKKVERAIHLVRNPFHNVVARFNLERHARIKQNQTEWLDAYPANATGFQQWCHVIDHRFQKQDLKFFGKERKQTLKYGMEDVPCHGEFYKYVQWHNMAHEVLRMSGMATLVVHYEDFGTKFDTTIASIFRFLQLDVEDDNVKAFHARSDYDNYFSKQAVKLITKLIKRLSSKETWEDMKRYLL